MKFQAGLCGFSDDNGMGYANGGMLQNEHPTLTEAFFPVPNRGRFGDGFFCVATSDSSEDMEPFDEKKMRKRKVRCLPARKNAQNSEIGCVLLASGIHGLAREHD